MHKRLIATLTSFALTLSLLGCASNPSKQDLGTVFGGIVGGVVGNQFGGGSGKTLFTIAGAIAGAYVGSAVGRSMDERDQRLAAVNLRNGLQSSVYSPDREGQPVARSSWTNDTRRYESAVRTYPVQRENCKEYIQDVVVVIDGRKEVATSRGIACKNPHTGEWEIQKH